MAWEARWGLKPGDFHVPTVPQGVSSLNGVGGPLEGRKYSESAIDLVIIVFEEISFVLLGSKPSTNWGGCSNGQ